VELPLRYPVPEPPARESMGVRLDGARIVVVEDEADARQLLATALGARGAEVRLATSAEEALGEVARWDIGMPGTDGHELLRRIRAMAGAAGQVPAIALTAYAGPEDRARALAVGYRHHLPKPVEIQRLIELAARLVRA
jgi:CheY-like chemotaxis protein